MWGGNSGTLRADYELDGVGNRKTVIKDGQTETYVTNSVNEYVYVNNQRLMYDQNGNLTSWNGKKLHYNHNNQLVEVTYAEGGFDWNWWFRYGVLGRRMTESFSNGLVYHRNFWYDGQMVIYEKSDGVKYRYYNGNLIDEVLCREDQFGGQIWYLTDALGSVYILTDNAGNVVEAYHYSIYGGPKVYSATGQQRNLTDYDNRVLFTGREYIWQLELYYYRARWYAPFVGSFLSRDPLYWSCFYSYACLNPLLLVDPDGLQPQLPRRWSELMEEEKRLQEKLKNLQERERRIQERFRKKMEQLRVRMLSIERSAYDLRVRAALYKVLAALLDAFGCPGGGLLRRLGERLERKADDLMHKVYYTRAYESAVLSRQMELELAQVKEEAEQVLEAIESVRVQRMQVLLEARQQMVWREQEEFKQNLLARELGFSEPFPCNTATHAFDSAPVWRAFEGKKLMYEEIPPALPSVVKPVFVREYMRKFVREMHRYTWPLWDTWRK